jgi:hypothetical protein
MHPSLIVVVDSSENGELFPEFGPTDKPAADRAARAAKSLVDKDAGVTAWSRETSPDIGEYGPPVTLFVNGASG